MPYNYYKPGETEPLSSAYNAYVAAQTADKERAQRRTELTVQSLLELGQQQDRKKANEEALKVEREKIKADADWHERYGNLQERQIKVQENEATARTARRDTLARAYGGGVSARSLLSGSTSTDGSVGGGGGPGGSAGGARQPHYLEQFGLSQQDLANLEPGDIQQMQQLGMAFEDQQRQNQQAATKKAADEAEIAGAHAAVDAAGDEAIPKALRAQMKLRIADAASAKEVNKEVTTALEELHAKEMAQAELDAMIPETEKLLKEARPGDLQGLARLKAFKKVQGHTASDPRKDLELFKKERAEILGTKIEAPKEPDGPDIAGLGKDWNLSSALKAPGEYVMKYAPGGGSGKPVLPAQVEAELTGIAEKKLESHPIFANLTTQLAAGGLADDPAMTMKFKSLMDEMVDKEKLRFLTERGWKEVAQEEMRDVGGVRALGGGNPKSDVDRLEEALSTGKVAGDKASLEAWMKANVSPERAMEMAGVKPKAAPASKAAAVAQDVPLRQPERPKFIRAPEYQYPNAMGPGKGTGKTGGSTEAEAKSILEDMAEKVGKAKSFAERGVKHSGKQQWPERYEIVSGELEQAVGEYEALYGPVPKATFDKMLKARGLAK